MPKKAATGFEKVVERPGYPGRDWMRLYLQHLEESENERKGSSHRAYNSIWRAYLIFLARRGSNVRLADVALTKAFLKAYKSATRLKYGRLLDRVYRWATSTRRATHNPFEQLQDLLNEEEQRSPCPAIELRNVKQLIRALPEPEDWQERRDQAIAVLAVGAGLRLSELRELTPTQLVPTSKGLQVQVRGRTAKTREILLDPAVATFMNAWLETRASIGFLRTSKVLFPSRRGSTIPVNTFYQRLRLLLQRVYGEDALPRFGIGVLRATYAQHFDPQAELVEAQQSLGHRRLESTLRFFRQLKPIPL